MADYTAENGFYWRPLGGNNIDQISGHCYQYTDVIKSKKEISRTTIIVDLGKFDNHQALGIKNSAAAFQTSETCLTAGIYCPRLFLSPIPIPIILTE